MCYRLYIIYYRVVIRCVHPLILCLASVACRIIREYVLSVECSSTVTAPVVMFAFFPISLVY